MRYRWGCAAWVAGVMQFFVFHGIVQSAWARPYSWARNNISDLGNAHCAWQPDPEPRFVCSPQHTLMDASFVVLGVLFVAGVALTGGLWRRGATAVVSRLLLAGAGTGYVLAGLAPADVSENQHVLGALLIMGTGNLGLLLAGAGLEVPGSLRWGSALLGAVALAAVVLFLSHHYLGLGMGGMERVAAFPLLVWAAVLGVRGLAVRAAVPRP
ncbi:DUF998 domain-containing protein [Streptomyces sp. NPDC005728]|uniref:DUF998 domain-containing protein n=1 Tax=Streptomyces sp. NPDC005728 TaxID=3157054 RepID=UPI0033FDBCCB